MSDEGKREKAFKEFYQTIKTLFSLLLFFPVWWLIVGYFSNCAPNRQVISGVVIFTGGVVGFFIAFVCNGGAGGSSEMSAAAWGCYLPYMVIHNIALAIILFTGKPRSVS